jgi:hypothetical protein
MSNNEIFDNNRNEIDRLIENNAFLRWVDAGRPEGRDLEFWTAAEAEIFGIINENLHW